MRKTFLFAIVAAAAAFASCSENTDINTTEVTNLDEPQVQITFGSDPATRAFFDASAAAEPRENAIKTLDIFVFKESTGTLIVHKKASEQEIEAKSVRMSLPRSAIETLCLFYVAANAADYHNNGATVADLEASVVSDLYMYNGTHTSTGCDNFVMTGTQRSVISGGASSYVPVPVSLKRVVAKVAVRSTVSPAFRAANNNGTVFITSAEIRRISRASYLFALDSRYNPGNASEWFPEYSNNNNGVSENLFYIYENGPLAVGDRVLLILKGVFDVDGSEATTDDRFDVKYEIELDGSGDGAIVRNTYYRIDAVINGLPGDGVKLEYTVADWETPVTQTVNLGN